MNRDDLENVIYGVCLRYGINSNRLACEFECELKNNYGFSDDEVSKLVSVLSETVNKGFDPDSISKKFTESFIKNPNLYKSIEDVVTFLGVIEL
jgi:hypothetical protein